MKSLPKIFSNFVLDTLFPVHCFLCGQDNAWICERCLSQIKINTEHVCGVCEKVSTPDGRSCQECKKKNHLDGLIVASFYTQNSISQAVHLFKYRFISDLHVPLGNLMIKTIQKTEMPLPDFIIPIPLHQRRLRWRGFNQSELLSNHLAKNLLPDCELEMCADLLIRNRYTPPQMQIKNYSQRKQNISGAFSLKDSKLVKNKTILLVDDIATTGSTIFECAKILKTAGANEVFAVVIARQETKKI